MTKYIRKRHMSRLVTTLVVVLGIVILTIGGIVFLNKFGAHLPQNVDLHEGVSGISLVVNKLKNVLSARTENSTSNLVSTELLLKIGVISDSHGAKILMEKAVNDMKIDGIDLILHLGDFSAGGEEESFIVAHQILEDSGIEYHVLPGDHDFNWYPTHSRENYEKSFGESYDQYFEKNRIGIIMFENSINVDDKTNQIAWLQDQLNLTKSTQVRLFFSARPLYSPYFDYKEDIQGVDVIDLLAEAGIRDAFAGDTHLYAQYKDLSNRLEITTVGAIGEYKNPLPQWVSVDVYADGTVKVASHPIANF